MKFNFISGNVSVFKNGEVALLVTLPKEYNKQVDKLTELIESDTLKTLEVKKFRKKRSHNANSYMWVLLGKLATKLGRIDDDLYIEYLKDYGTKEYVEGLAEMEESLKKMCKIVEVKKDTTINNKEGVVFKLIRGSSTYNSLEMSNLIEPIVRDCEEQGIQTMTPQEIEKLLQEWGDRHE